MTYFPAATHPGRRIFPILGVVLSSTSRASRSTRPVPTETSVMACPPRLRRTPSSPTPSPPTFLSSSATRPRKSPRSPLASRVRTSDPTRTATSSTRMAIRCLTPTPRSKRSTKDSPRLTISAPSSAPVTMPKTSTVAPAAPSFSHSMVASSFRMALFRPAPSAFLMTRSRRSTATRSSSSKTRS